MNNVRDFGALGDGITKDTAAIQKAIDAGGMVFFPPGIYLSGTLYLKSDGGLELAPGAVLLASPDKEDYNADDFCVQNSVFAKENVSGAHFIIAVEQKNIIIRGGGVIDGNRKAFYNEIWQGHPHLFKLTDWRPAQMVFFCECENIRISEVELNKTHNGDGSDIDCCRFVTGSDCIIHSADDCITFRGNDKTLKHKKPCEFITVTNCILGSRCNAFRIGVGNGTVRNCTVSDIVIQNTRTGIQINSRYSPDSEGVTIENFLFSDILMEVKRPVAVCSDVRGPHDQEIKPIRNIVFRNLNGSACWSCFVESNRRGDIRDIVFSGAKLRYSGGEDVEEGSGLTYAEFGTKNAPAAFHLTNAEEVTFRDVKIEWNTDSPNWKCAVMAVNSQKLLIDGCVFGKKILFDGEPLG